MAEELHISSLIVHGRPADLADIRAAVAAMCGVEVHAAEAGKIIVTLETANEQEIIDRITTISLLDGVLSAVLVFHQVEMLPAPEQMQGKA